METLHCSEAHIAATLSHLQAGGRRGVECVVLWLARQDRDRLVVEHVSRPEHYARADVFRIPPTGMRALMNVLSAENLMIAAQVHSHPREAFHSRADDAWAIVRHEDALSVVVPDFALRTSAASFSTDAKVFRLSSSNEWIEIPCMEVPQWLKLT